MEALGELPALDPPGGAGRRCPGSEARSSPPPPRPSALTEVAGAHLLHHAICLVLHLALRAQPGHWIGDMHVSGMLVSAAPLPGARPGAGLGLWLSLRVVKPSSRCPRSLPCPLCSSSHLHCPPHCSPLGWRAARQWSQDAPAMPPAPLPGGAVTWLWPNCTAMQRPWSGGNWAQCSMSGQGKP